MATQPPPKFYQLMRAGVLRIRYVQLLLKSINSQWWDERREVRISVGTNEHGEPVYSYQPLSVRIDNDATLDDLYEYWQVFGQDGVDLWWQEVSSELPPKRA